MSIINKIKSWLTGDTHITQSPQSPANQAAAVAPIVAKARAQKNAQCLTSAQVDLIKSLKPQGCVELRDELGGGDLYAIARTARTHAAKAFGSGCAHVFLVPKRSVVMVYRLEKQ